MILDGELAGLPGGLKAGSALTITLHLGLDGRLRVTAREPRSRTELTELAAGERDGGTRRLWRLLPTALVGTAVGCALCPSR